MFYLFFFETMHRNGYIIISFHQKEEKKYIRGDFERGSEWGRRRRGGGREIRSKMTRSKILYACTLLKGNSSNVRSL